MPTDKRRILVCGATGKQGGAVVKALLAKPPPFDHEIVVLTRKPNSASAQRFAENPIIQVVQGDMDDCPAIFEACGGKGSIWGVFCMTMPSMKKLQEGIVDKEVRQGNSMIDAAIENRVQHFVFSSVDRGGEKSFDNPTPIPHFITKHDIEHHLRNACVGSGMTWTILRPVAFMDNLMPNIIGRIFAASWAQMEPTKLQLVATKDVGIFAALALSNSESDDFKNKAIGLAGDNLSQSEAAQIFWNVIQRPMVQTYWFVANFVKYMMSDLGIMFKWFETDGYGVDMAYCKKLNPEMLDFKTWLAEESKFD